MPLQAAVQGRARQVGDRRLKGVQAVIERQQRMSLKCNDDGFILEGQECRLREFGAGR